MRTFVWPAEDGWPYPDSDGDDGGGALDVVDVANEMDEDALALRLVAARAMGSLDTVERRVLEGRFGIGGAPVRSMKQLHADLGLPRAEIRAALGSGLEKLRVTLA